MTWTFEVTVMTLMHCPWSLGSGSWQLTLNFGSRSWPLTFEVRFMAFNLWVNDVTFWPWPMGNGRHLLTLNFWVKIVTFDLTFRSLQLFWYSELFLQLHKWLKLLNGLDDVKIDIVRQEKFYSVSVLKSFEQLYCFPAPLSDLWNDTLNEKFHTWTCFYEQGLQK